MRLFHLRKRVSMTLASLTVALTGLGAIFAQGQQSETSPPKAESSPNNPALRSPARPSPTGTSTEPQINPQELERLTKAADKVLNRIQAEENDLYLRVSYFEKPERLNPNSYASKEELGQWQTLFQQFKEKHELVSQLYTNVGKDLETELRNAGGGEQIVARFKKFIMDGFPWATIEKKRTLIADLADEEAKLLMFYEK